MSTGFWSELDIVQFLRGMPSDIRAFFAACLLLLAALAIKRLFVT